MYATKRYTTGDESLMLTAVASKVAAVVAPEVTTVVEVRASACAAGAGCAARVVVVVSVVKLGKRTGA